MYTQEAINYLCDFSTLLNGHDVSISLDRLNIGIGFDWLRLSLILHLRCEELFCVLRNFSKYRLQGDLEISERRSFRRVKIIIFFILFSIL